MKKEEQDIFIQEIIGKINQIDELKNFFYFLIIFRAFDPYINLKFFNSKKKFLMSLDNLNSYAPDSWILTWLLDLFSVKIDPELLEYLNSNDIWWDYISNNQIGIYEISYIYESLEESIKRKRTGSFFSPKDQIQLICRFSLFFYLKNKTDLYLNEEFLYKLIFTKNHPLDLSEDTSEQMKLYLQNIRIIDPSCGSGIFLIEMIDLIISRIFNILKFRKISFNERKSILNTVVLNCYGFDINKTRIKIAKTLVVLKVFSILRTQELEQNYIFKMLVQLNFYEQDFLKYKLSKGMKFDICIGNPPYVRHHSLSSSDTKGMISISDFTRDLKDFFPKTQIKWDRKADLYVYFCIKSAAIIVSKGIIAFILSRSWFSSQYAKPIYQIFEDYYTLDLIIELPFEVWSKAEIRTNIIFGHREASSDVNKQMTFLIWKESVKELLNKEELLLNQFNKRYEINMPNGEKIGISALESISHRNIQVSNYLPFLSAYKGIFPIIRFDYLEMAPFILIDILLQNRDKFCLLKNLGILEMGSTTGANWFFYLDKQKAEKWNIPIDKLHPMTKSPKDWRSFNSIHKKRLKYFLHIPQKNKIDILPSISKYLDHYQELILRRPYFKNKTRDNWFRVDLIKPELLIPNMIYKRSFVVFNQNYHIDKQWIGFWANNKDWNSFLIAFFNSSLGILLREIQGTKTLGLGSLKISLKECQNLLILDPRGFPNKLMNDLKQLVEQLSNYHIQPILKSMLDDKNEKLRQYYIIREKIDRIFLKDYLGLNFDSLDKLNQLLKYEVEWRFVRKQNNN